MPPALFFRRSVLFLRLLGLHPLLERGQLGPFAAVVLLRSGPRLDGREDATVSLHCDKTVAVDEVVKVMNIAKDNGYKLILATSAN